MSLILEALRKSEAERRRGQSPDLFAELPPASRLVARRSPPWHWLLLVAATLAIAGWAARGFLGDRPSMPTSVAAKPVVDAGRAVPDPVPPPPTLNHPAAPVATAPSRPVLVARTPVPAAPAPAPDTSPRPATTTFAAAAPPRPLPQPTLPDPEPTVALPPPPEDVAVRAAPPVAAAAAPRGVIAPTAAPTAPTSLLHLADLSAADREQLPPLKMSMHMWGQDPARRFAIIDGSRVTEGDRIGAAVVDEISADGVVLSWNGLHLELPVR